MISSAFIAGYVAFWGLLASLGVTAIGYSGKLTLTAVATLVLAGGTFLFALLQRTRALVPRPFQYYIGFLLYVYLSFSWGGLSKQGIQNAVVFTIPLLIFLLQLDARSLERALGWLVAGASVIVCLPYLALAAIHGPGHYVGYAPRPLALFCLILIAWLAPEIRFAPSRLRRFWLLALAGIVQVTTFATLARTASAIGLMALLAGLFFHPRRLGRMLVLASVPVLGFLMLPSLIESNDVIAERFAGHDTVNVLGLEVNFSSRTILWRNGLESFAESGSSMLFGKGAGTISRALVLAEQPHNEYLRLLHDYGFVGFSLAMLFYGSLTLRVFGAMVAAFRSGDLDQARVQMQGFLALMAYLSGAFFLNPFVYVFIVTPLFMILKRCALGAPGRGYTAGSVDG
jgi:hypothetical protein